MLIAGVDFVGCLWSDDDILGCAPAGPVKIARGEFEILGTTNAKMRLNATLNGPPKQSGARKGKASQGSGKYRCIAYSEREMIDINIL